MRKKLKQNKAQSVGEYSLVLGLVLLVIVGMTFFIQRALMARVNDARVYVGQTLDAEIDLAHTAQGLPVFSGVLYEYEPYSRQRQSAVETSAQDNMVFNAEDKTYIEQSGRTTLSNSISQEAPAQDDFFDPGGGPGGG